VSLSAPTPSHDQQTGLTITQWLIVIMAAIGFAFDIYELLMLPLVLRPAILELGTVTPADKGFAEYMAFWRSLMFYVPAVAGGIFGLLGGYLTDTLGRRRVLTWSILLYSVSAFLAGYSTSLPMLLVLRSAKFIGVCVEFVAAIAWLAELFPEPHQRERVLGYTQAFSSFGGLLVAVANSMAISLAADLPAVRVPEFAVAALGRDRAGPSARRVAVHLSLRLDPRDPAGPDSAVPARVAGVAAEEGGRHAQAGQSAFALHRDPSADDARDDDHVRLQLRRRLRGDPADAGNRPGACRRQGEDRGPAAAEAARNRAEDRR